MNLGKEDRGVLVGAFIVEGGDEILCITASGQVVRSPINENFRSTGRSTQGVKFVSPKKNDSVVVVARSVEARDEEEATESVEDAALVEGATIDESGQVVDQVDQVDEAPAETVTDEEGDA